MALTREFKDTLIELCKDPEYRKGLLLVALESYLEGEIAVGNSMLSDYLNGTQAFDQVARDLQMQETGLRRMVGPSGNATAKNFFRLFKICQEREGIKSADEFLGLAMG